MLYWWNFTNQMNGYVFMRNLIMKKCINIFYKCLNIRIYVLKHKKFIESEYNLYNLICQK